jgi:hypothetical protein
MPAEGLESMFPCSRVEEVAQFYGPAIVQLHRMCRDHGT